MTSPDIKKGGFVRQAGIEIPAGAAVVPTRPDAGPQTVAERLRRVPARTSEPNKFIGPESMEHANQMSPAALRKAKRQAGIRYMGQPK